MKHLETIKYRGFSIVIFESGLIKKTISVDVWDSANVMIQIFNSITQAIFHVDCLIEKEGQFWHR